MSTNEHQKVMKYIRVIHSVLMQGYSKIPEIKQHQSINGSLTIVRVPATPDVYDDLQCTFLVDRSIPYKEYMKYICKYSFNESEIKQYIDMLNFAGKYDGIKTTKALFEAGVTELKILQGDLHPYDCKELPMHGEYKMTIVRFQ